MAKQQDIIELNGKIYNLKSSKTQAMSLSGINKPVKVKLVSDFAVPKPQSVIKPTPPDKPSIISKPVKFRTGGSSTLRHQLQKSTILMRKSVKKPKTAQKEVTIGKSYSQSHTHIRAGRASQAKQSPYIHKFKSSTKPLSAKVKPIAVTPTPIKKQTAEYASFNNNQQSHQFSKADLLVAKTLQNIGHTASAKSKKPKAHQKLKWGSAIMSVFILIGFFAFLNLPVLNMKIASAQAGFSATLPNYKPAGYSLTNPINHQAGKIILGFKSNTDDRSYTIKQEVSNWNSQSLLENVISKHNLAFTTAQDKGLTVYYYDNGKATWVNGGVWYQIESNSLNSSQLANIASSM